GPGVGAEPPAGGAVVGGVNGRALRSVSTVGAAGGWETDAPAGGDDADLGIVTAVVAGAAGAVCTAGTAGGVTGAAAAWTACFRAATGRPPAPEPMTPATTRAATVATAVAEPARPVRIRATPGAAPTRPSSGICASTADTPAVHHRAPSEMPMNARTRAGSKCVPAEATSSSRAAAADSGTL